MNTPHKGLSYFAAMRSADGRLIDLQELHFEHLADNLVPMEGFNALLSYAFKQVAVPPNWYVSIFSGDYTPDDTVTAATLPGLATEITAYTPGTRPVFTPGAVSGGQVSNAAALAEFTFTTQQTVRLIGLSSASAKGSTAGVLLSVARLATPKTYDVGSVMSVFAAPTMQPITP